MGTAESDLVPSAWAGGSMEEWAQRLGVPRLEVYRRLPSTNLRARELVAEGAADLTAVVAGAQTEGRGRGGARWHSAEDSGLWISFVLPIRPGTISAVLPLAVGVAAARAIEAASGALVGLKWPNDLLLGDRKVGGVLCEMVGGESVAGESAVLAGIGVNLRPPRVGVPQELLSTATYLEEVCGAPVAEPDLARLLAMELRCWANPPPPTVSEKLRAEWEARDRLRRAEVMCEGGLRGVVLGIADDGGLVIVDGDGRKTVVRSGSVRLTTPGESAALHTRRGRES